MSPDFLYIPNMVFYRLPKIIRLSAEFTVLSTKEIKKNVLQYIVSKYPEILTWYAFEFVHSKLLKLLLASQEAGVMLEKYLNLVFT